MNRLISIFKNKYFIASIALLVWMLFFDRYDLTTQYNYQKEKNKLESDKKFYISENERIGKAIHDIKFNPNIIQKIAREKYQMKKNNEDIFIIETINTNK